MTTYILCFNDKRLVFVKKLKMEDTTYGNNFVEFFPV